ncbi:MAG: PaaI family thioesterase [Acidobacteria bacterium]|nr:PaaI family thioesterase [Acidobacteriota bacterium]
MTDFTATQPDGVHDALGIEVVSARADEVVVRVPVTAKVRQPYGILHGGVSALIAESAASIGGAIAAGPDRIIVGTELNCSHLRSVRDGVITATARPIRIGRTVHVWGIDVTDSDGKQICIARCSLAVLAAPTA